LFDLENPVIVDGMVDSRRFLDGFGNLIQMPQKLRGGNIPELQSSERVPIYWLRKATWKLRFRTKGSATD
jgi:hypothetical protein